MNFYHQGSGSSCVILGEMDGTKVLITQLNPSRGALLTRPSSLDAGIRGSESHFSFGLPGKRYVEHFPCSLMPGPARNFLHYASLICHNTSITLSAGSLESED